jgi:hypothetical protein
LALLGQATATDSQGKSVFAAPPPPLLFLPLHCLLYCLCVCLAILVLFSSTCCEYSNFTGDCVSCINEAEEEVLVVVASATVVESWNWWVCCFYFSSTSLGYYCLCVQKKQLDAFF